MSAEPDLLRRAAARAREVAANVTPGAQWTDGNYWITDYDPRDPSGQTAMQRLIGGMESPDHEHYSLWDPTVAVLVADWLEGIAETHQADPDPMELMLHMDEDCPTGECETGDGHMVIVCRGCYPAWDDMPAHSVWPCAEYTRAEPLARALLNEAAGGTE